MLLLTSSHVRERQARWRGAVVLLIEEFPQQGVDRSALIPEVWVIADIAWKCDLESCDLVHLYIFAANVFGPSFGGYSS